MSVEYNTLALDDTEPTDQDAPLTTRQSDNSHLVAPNKGVIMLEPDPEPDAPAPHGIIKTFLPPQDEPTVRLAIYDISKGWARILSPMFLCRHIDVAPHTSILHFGQEYFWAGGIQKMRHEDFVEQVGHAPVEYLDLGPSGIPEDLFHDFILTISPRYTAETYDLLSNNCNHFSQECAQFLVGKDIPEPILDAGLKVKQSFVGRIVVGCAGLTPAARTMVSLKQRTHLCSEDVGVVQAMVGTEAACALIAMSLLLSMSNTDPETGTDCPTSPDQTVRCLLACTLSQLSHNYRFAIVVFMMLLAWSISGLVAIGHAVAFERPMPCLPPPLWLEVVGSVILAFMLYTAAVGISVLHSSVGRLFPERCTISDPNYRKLCAVVALVWFQGLVMLVTKLTSRVSTAVQLTLQSQAEDRPPVAAGFGSSPVTVRETDWN